MYLYDDHPLPPCVCCKRWEVEIGELCDQIKSKDNIMSGLELEIIKWEDTAKEEKEKTENLKRKNEGQMNQIKDLEKKIEDLKISKYINNEWLNHSKFIINYKLQYFKYCPTLKVKYGKTPKNGTLF